MTRIWNIVLVLAVALSSSSCSNSSSTITIDPESATEYTRPPSTSQTLINKSQALPIMDNILSSGRARNVYAVFSRGSQLEISSNGPAVKGVNGFGITSAEPLSNDLVKLNNILRQYNFDYIASPETIPYQSDVPSPSTRVELGGAASASPKDEGFLAIFGLKEFSPVSAKALVLQLQAQPFVVEAGIVAPLSEGT